jgi:hypothetical protein
LSRHGLSAKALTRIEDSPRRPSNPACAPRQQPLLDSPLIASQAADLLRGLGKQLQMYAQITATMQQALDKLRKLTR